MNAESKPPSKHFSFKRFSLRSAIILLTATCVSLGLYIEPVIKQQAAVRKIRHFNGTVEYDYDKANYLYQWIPSWIQEKFNNDYFCEVRSVTIDSRDVTDISMLRNLLGLQEIIIKLVDGQTNDLTPISKITGLQTLAISGASFVDLEPVANLHQLDYLSLGTTEAKSLAPLAKLTKLQVLRISGNQIDTLEPLAGLKLLKTFEFAGESVQSLQPLANLRNLQYLRVKGKSIVDLSPLKNLSGIRYLHVKHTGVTDLTPVKNFGNLITIDFSYTPVSQVDALVGIRSLENVRMTHTDVVDLTPFFQRRNLANWYLGTSPDCDRRPRTREEIEEFIRQQVE